MTDDLASTLGQKETATLEFKRGIKDKDLRAIRKTICAFANDLPNAGGGDLLIGVDDKGDPVGAVDASDAALLRLTNIRDDGSILDRPSVIVPVGTFAAAPVIRVRVNASRTPPVRYEGVAYVRSGPSTRAATRDDERVLSERRKSRDLPFDVRPLPGGRLEDLDLTLFRGASSDWRWTPPFSRRTSGRLSCSSPRSGSPLSRVFPPL